MIKLQSVVDEPLGKSWLDWHWYC